MSPAEIGLVCCIFCAAVLYSSVGHAGGSGYLASMALFAVAPETMKPAALVLNILVATIATTRFVAAKAFSAKLFLPLALASAPLAFLGGGISLSDRSYKVLVAIALVAAIWRLVHSSTIEDKPVTTPPLWQLLLLGMVIGILSGLTGVGGGIYLTPVILFANWAPPKIAGGVSAAFILVNSITGLAGRWQAAPSLPPHIGYWAVAAVLGGLIGSHLGVTQFGSNSMKRLLAIVLAVAAVKLAFG